MGQTHENDKNLQKFLTFRKSTIIIISKKFSLYLVLSVKSQNSLILIPT